MFRIRTSNRYSKKSFLNATLLVVFAIGWFFLRYPLHHKLVSHIFFEWLNHLDTTVHIIDIACQRLHFQIFSLYSHFRDRNFNRFLLALCLRVNKNEFLIYPYAFGLQNRPIPNRENQECSTIIFNLNTTISTRSSSAIIHAFETFSVIPQQGIICTCMRLFNYATVTQFKMRPVFIGMTFEFPPNGRIRCWTW